MNLFKKLALLALTFCTTIHAEQKVYINHIDGNRPNNCCKITLEDGEIVEIAKIYGDENGIYIYESDLISSNRPMTFQITQKFTMNKEELFDENAWMIEAKLIYYRCEMCAEWRVIGYACKNTDCPSNRMQ